MSLPPINDSSGSRPGLPIPGRGGLPVPGRNPGLPKPNQGLPPMPPEPSSPLPPLQSDLPEPALETQPELSVGEAEETPEYDDIFESLNIDELLIEDEIDAESEEDSLNDVNDSNIADSNIAPIIPENLTTNVNTNEVLDVSNNINDISNDNNSSDSLESVIPENNIETPKKTRKRSKIKTEDTFIDKESKKLLPFGSKEKNKKDKSDIKVDYFDSRKNLKQKALFIQIGVISLLVAILGFSIKNSFWPPQGVDQSEVINIVERYTGEVGFPMEKGAAFVENFTEIYLTNNPDNNNIDVLNYFYTGNFTNSTQDVEYDRNLKSNLKQTIVMKPKVVFERALAEYSARFQTLTLVKQDTSKVDSEDTESGVVTTNYKWITLDISVYYDEANQTLSIIPGSPTIVPNSDIVTPKTVVPPAQKPTGVKADDQTHADVGRIISHYLEQYGKASANNYDDMKQYIKSSDIDPSVYQGFNGELEFVSNSLIYETIINDSNEIKVIATTSWVDPLIEEDSITYNSQFVITLVKEGEKFVVTKIAPMNYLAETSK